MAAVVMPLQNYVRRFSLLHSFLQRELYRGLKEVAENAKLTLAAATRSAPAASPNGKPGAIASGRYLARWRTRRVRRANSIGVLIYNNRPYAQRVEFGRFIGSRPPPVNVIAKWARLRLGVSSKEARRVAWPISQAISKRGLKGRYVLTGDRTRMTLQFYMKESIASAVLTAANKVFV